jgi:hypothetical protein
MVLQQVKRLWLASLTRRRGVIAVAVVLDILESLLGWFRYQDVSP